jgi:hypothetical protein
MKNQNRKCEINFIRDFLSQVCRKLMPDREPNNEVTYDFREVLEAKRQSRQQIILASVRAYPKIFAISDIQDDQLNHYTHTSVVGAMGSRTTDAIYAWPRAVLICQQDRQLIHEFVMDITWRILTGYTGCTYCEGGQGEVATFTCTSGKWNLELTDFQVPNGELTNPSGTEIIAKGKVNRMRELEIRHSLRLRGGESIGRNNRS